ncbi:hypothetical protein BsWGS_11936 [Bradybaena similaris]
MKGHTMTSTSAPVMKNKQAADNQKRLKAIQENLKLKQAQHSIHLPALKDVDSSKNLGQRIVFKDDSSDDDDNELSKDDKKLTLFDSEPEDEGVEEIFKSKPHLEGKKGEKLMRLEQRIGDPRFKLDARFALSDSEEEDEDDYEEKNKPLTDIDKSLEQEKLANLKVLESIVGKTTLDRFSEKLKRNVKHITDMNKLRFDPTKIQKTEAVPIDKKQTPQEKEKITSNQKLVDTKTKAAKKKTDNEKKPTDTVKQIAADVKKPSVSAVPRNLFGEEEMGSFSLMKQFDQQSDDEEMQSEDDDNVKGDGIKSPGPLSALFKDQAKKADVRHDKTTPAKSLHSEGLGSTTLFKHQTKIENAGDNKMAPTKVGFVNSEEEIDSSSSSEEEMDGSSSSEEDMHSDTELLHKDDRLPVMTDKDGIDQDLINAGRVDIRFTKEQWLERWTEIRPVLVSLYKRKHKEAVKNKRKQEEFKRKKEFIKRSRKNRFRKTTQIKKV